MFCFWLRLMCRPRPAVPAPAAVAPAAKSHRLSPVCANGFLTVAAVELREVDRHLRGGLRLFLLGKGHGWPNARMLTAAARATALCRVRTGLDRPGDRRNLIAFAGYAEDVARDAGRRFRLS